MVTAPLISNEQVQSFSDVNSGTPLKRQIPTYLALHNSDTASISKHDANEKSLERRLLRKLDCTLMPVVSLLYLFSFLDRGNIGNARLGSLEKDLNLQGDDFYNALSIFYVGYVLFQIPANIALKLQGISSSSIAATFNFSGLLAARFFLGCWEAGVAPSIPLLLSFWYQRNEMAGRISIFFGSSTLAGAFGGIFAWVIIGHMDGIQGLASWRWLFLVEGLPTVVLGILCLMFLPNYPATANTRWWLTPEEKELAIRRVPVASDDASFSRKQFVAVFKDYQNAFYTLIYISVLVSISSYSTFLPTIIRDMGVQSLQAQLLTIPPYIVACCCLFVVAWYSDHTQQRGLPALLCFTVTIIGYVFLLVGEHLALRYCGAIFVASGVYSTVPVILSWINNNNHGHTKRGVSLGLMNGVAQCFGILGSHIYRNEDAPFYRPGHAICLAFSVFAFIMIAILRFLLQRENRRRDKLQQDHATYDVELYDRHPAFRYIP
ncbi:mfs transporter [Lichtheimia corymbifera JMRC:FSU:9682]|uniref:Mfs transporter n=1 Tax=Lichtheimia corymbifera JMRC:FSU:9682 TaxID=1263082 RepID=A0A068S855_9FUNG|nr:mfs transporter [Lichtheimia corymbifera JMRC:FSU:9682]